MPIGIAYLDGPRLARSMYAAADWVQAGRDEINRLNVFPVPDGDTGTNFSLTLRAVSDALQALGNAPLGATAGTAARAAVLGARGNSGMMLAHFLLGFAESIGERRTAGTREIAAAIRRGADTLYSSLDEPREGTILTVAREAAQAAEVAAAESSDIGEFMRRMYAEGERSLARTPTLLAVLREAGVVDAGGKGFVRMLEGVVRLIQGDPILAAAPGVVGLQGSPAADFTVAAERDYQFCTECLVRGEQLPSSNEVRFALHQFGGSVVAAQVGDILKMHVHTDTPEAVFAFAERWGSITFRKADDMRAQHRALGHEEARRPVAILADSSADLPDAVLDRHHIALVPLQITFGDTTYRDRVGLKPPQFYQMLREAKALPTTSQPTPGEFVKAFRSAAAEADEVVAVLLSSALSGTFQAGQAAARADNLKQVHLFDSQSASLGLGMLALRAAELAESGWDAKAIVTELERVRGQSGLFLTVDTYENLLRSGRVSRGKAWLAGMLDVKPILSLEAGRVVPVDRVRGREQLVARVLQLVDKALTPRPKSVRFGIAHAEAPETAERLRTALVAAYRPRDCFVSLATGVLGTHAGPGAWAVCYQVEDGTPTTQESDG